MKRVARLVIVATLALAGPLPAAELGRLFFSSAERAALDRARHAQPQLEAESKPEREGLDLTQVEEFEPVMADAVRVDGFVARSGGPQTVWVNGMDSHQGNFGDIGIDPNRVRIEASRVRLPLGSAANGVLLKPGQSFDPGSELITDAYEKQDDAGAETDDSERQ